MDIEIIQFVNIIEDKKGVKDLSIYPKIKSSIEDNGKKLKVFIIN
jgi:hypothetical protein